MRELLYMSKNILYIKFEKAAREQRQVKRAKLQ